MNYIITSIDHWDVGSILSQKICGDILFTLQDAEDAAARIWRTAEALMLYAGTAGPIYICEVIVSSRICVNELDEVFVTKRYRFIPREKDRLDLIDDQLQVQHML